MTEQLKEGGFTVGGGASGVSMVPGPVDTGSTKRKQDKEGGEKAMNQVADVTPQNGGGSAEQNRASVAAKGDPTSVKVQSMESAEKIKEIFKGQDLSEDFVKKAATIWEAVVGEQVAAAEQKLTEEYAQKLEAAITEQSKTMVDQIDTYMDYVVGQWMEENKLALESSLKAEITEDFMNGLKKLFEEHHISIPEDKVEVVEELVAKVEELEEKLNSSINENLELKKFKTSAERRKLVDTMSESLSVQQKEKFQSLMENVTAENEEEFSSKAKTIKEEYFGQKSTTVKPQTLTEQTEKSGPVEEPAAAKRIDPTMERYTSAISRTVQK